MILSLLVDCRRAWAGHIEAEVAVEARIAGSPSDMLDLRQVARRAHCHSMID